GEAPDDVPRLGELPIGEVRIDVVDDDRSRAREGGEQQVGDELFEVVQRVQRRLPGEGQVEVRAPQRHVVERGLDRDVRPIGGVAQVAVEREFGVEADDVADAGDGHLFAHVPDLPPGGVRGEGVFTDG